jgi:multidrug resistance efflux pump
MNEKPTTEEQETTVVESEKAKKAVSKGGLVIALLILFSLIWYLLADRFTPYTTQARVQGYVVGVAPKVAGTVTQVWVKNNQEVEAGDRLFEIDPAQYAIALKRAQSDLENAQRQVGAGTAGVESAQAKLRGALANELKAEKDYQRLQRLYKEDPGTISVRRLEISQASLEQAQASVTAAEAEIQRAIEQRGGDEEDNNSILKSAQNAVEKAELDLSNTVVKAPTRGVITDLRTEVGLYAGTGSPVLTLVSIHDVWISAEFTENNLGHLQPGSPVEIIFDALPGQVYAGQVRSIGVGVDTGQNQKPGTLPTIQNSRDWLRQAQRFPVTVGFDTNQADNLTRQLRVGGQASVIAYSEEHGFLRLLGKLYIRLMSLLSYAY